MRGSTLNKRKPKKQVEKPISITGFTTKDETSIDDCTEFQYIPSIHGSLQP